MAFSIFSCEQETDFVSSNNIQTNNSEREFPDNPILADYRNGRLVFENQVDFDHTIETLKNLDENELNGIFDSFYDIGFIPLYPYYNEEEIDRIQEFFQKKRALLPPELENIELQYGDMLISDDLFASLLNYKREIVLEGKIYKYTFSGAFIAEEKDSLILKQYIEDNNINNFIPDPSTLPEGLVPTLNPEIDVFAIEWYNPCPPVLEIPMGSPWQALFPCDVYNGGSTGPSSDPNTNYTTALLNYIEDLQPCHVQEAGIGGTNFTPFGVRKECKTYFNNDHYRTQTLYYNESYLIYATIGVVVKHQKDRLIGWSRKRTDEVALIINQATFTIPNNLYSPISLPPFQVPLEPLDEAMIYYGGEVYTGSDFDNILSWTPTPATPPTTPFDEDIIIQLFSDDITLTQDIEITSDELNDLLYNALWNQVKTLFNNSEGTEPEKITMMITDNPGTIVSYFDMTRRKTNEKIIRENLDYNWSAGFSFNAYIDGNNGIVTDPSQFWNVTNYNIEIPNLLSYEKVQLDFVGVTRRGSEWKGDKMVYRSGN